MRDARPDMPLRRKIVALIRMGCMIGLASAISGCALSRQILYAPRGEPVAPPLWLHGAPERVQVRTSDGLLLAGYFWPGTPGGRDIIVFFHGRSGNAELGAKRAQHLAGAGNAVLVASYRGFGDNPGSPTERGLLRDAAAFIAEARTRSGPDGRIWLVGHSIGSAVALHAAAADRHVSGVIALSAFVRIADAAPRIARAFIPDRWNNFEALHALSIPVIFIQGGVDSYVPAESGDALFSSYGGPSSLVMGETSPHNPDMSIIAPWITQAISIMQTGSLASLPSPPPGWIEKVRHP